jgi:hypothetical protein
VRERRIDEGHPQQREDDERPEPHALGERATDQRRRDHRKHPLVHHEQHVGDRRRERARPLPDSAQKDEVEPADQAADVGAEGERVAEHRPVHADQAHDEDAVHDRAEDVLLPRHAAVEHRESRRHEEHERRRHQQPGRVAAIQSRRRITVLGNRLGGHQPCRRRNTPVPRTPAHSSGTPIRTADGRHHFS